MILHILVPMGASINDHIPKAPFPLQYTSVDDTVRMLVAHGPGALMVKADLKSAFRMIPVRQRILGVTWHKVAGSILL